MNCRIGKKQLRTLIMLGSPTMLLLVPGKSERGLIKRGLLRESEPGKACCISPAGLRVLANEMDAGRVEDALQAIRKHRERKLLEETS